MPYQIALVGFSEFERSALQSYFRLAQARRAAYVPVTNLTDADFLVADADHGPSVQLVTATERLAQTVFIGAQPPEGSIAWLTRPIDALRLMRALDGLAGVPEPEPEGADALPATDQPSRRTRIELAGERLSGVPATLQQTPPAVLARPAVLPAIRRALLVDDSELALHFLSNKLSRWDLQLDRASSSGKALELLAISGYDLIFLDVELGPGSHHDGLVLCRQIKRSAEWMHAAVVMVSAHNSQLDRARGALAGCDAYLGKPLDDVELQRLLLRQGLKAQRPAEAGPVPR
jgi:CheY-like chemotaxis protein